MVRARIVTMDDLQDFEGYEVSDGKKDKDDFGIYNED